MADTGDLKSPDREVVRVRSPPRVHTLNGWKQGIWIISRCLVFYSAYKNSAYIMSFTAMHKNHGLDSPRSQIARALSRESGGGLQPWANEPQRGECSPRSSDLEVFLRRAVKRSGTGGRISTPHCAWTPHRSFINPQRMVMDYPAKNCLLWILVF